MMCQCRVTDDNKCTPVVWDFDSGGGYACVGKEEYGKVCFLLNAVSLTLLLKTNKNWDGSRSHCSWRMSTDCTVCNGVTSSF